jgi:hypothetical protein
MKKYLIILLIPFLFGFFWMPEEGETLECDDLKCPGTYELAAVQLSGVALSGVGASGGAAAAATLVFSDGFESNDFTAWTSETDTATQISVGTTPHSGTYAMHYDYSNTADAYVQKTLAQNYTEFYVQFWFRVNDVTAVAAITGNQSMMTLMSRESSSQLIAVARTGTSPYNFITIRTIYYNDSGGALSDFTLNPSANTYYCYRAYRKKSTGTDTNDGILKVWVAETCGGGTSVDVTNIDDDTKDLVGVLRLGEYGVNEWLTTNSTQFLFDDFSFYSGAP